jgi:hypothetical protein
MKTLIEFRTKPSESRAEMLIRDDQLVATVDVEKNPDGFNLDWWVSGSTRNGELRLLLRFQVAITDAKAFTEVMTMCENYWEKELREMAWGSAIAGGIPDLASPPGVAVRRDHVRVHLKEHDELGNLDQGDLRVFVRTLHQYQLVKSFGYKSAQPLIAEFENLPLSTVVKRLSMARDSGLLPKQASKD